MLVIGSALAALAAAAMAVPVGAADTQGTLAVVNGIPGRKVDVCLNGKEIKGGLGYGDALLRALVSIGNKNLKIYARDPRKCRGTRLGQTSFELGPGDDLTIVATKNAPKVVTFDNTSPQFLGEIPPTGAPYLLAPFAVRSAADIAADFSYHWWSDVGDVSISPSAIFLKGQEYSLGGGIGFNDDNAVRVQATVTGSTNPVLAPIIQPLASHRYESILVGTRRANARLVVLDRLVSRPSP
jgi:hypothetical protein